MRWGETDRRGFDPAAQAYVTAMRVTREEVFGANDEQRPISGGRDAQIPQVGFLGAKYQEKGDVLFGINPGGGGAAYRRTPEDARLLPKIAELVEGEASQAVFTEMNDLYATNMRTWNLWRIVAPVLETAGRTQQDIAYINWCPYRTRDDKMPRAATMRNCHELIVAPLLTALKPRRVIALGKKVGDWLSKLPPQGAELFVVPRTIGDSHLSKDAEAVLAKIANLSGQKQ